LETAGGQCFEIGRVIGGTREVKIL
jgi:hypothetical protein